MLITDGLIQNLLTILWLTRDCKHQLNIFFFPEEWRMHFEVVTQHGWFL